MRPDPDRRSAPERRHLAGRVLLVLLVVAFLAAIGNPAAMAQTPPPATADPCANIASPIQQDVCRSQGTANQATQTAGNVAQNAVTNAGDSALRGLTAAVAAAGGWVLEKVGAVVTSTTSPTLDASWFVDQYQVMLAVAMLLALPMLLFSVIQGMLRGDMSHIIRSAFLFLPLAGIFSFIAPALVQLLIAITDWMSLAVSANAASDAQKFMTETGRALITLGAGTATPGVPVFGVLLASVLVLLGGFSIWIELLLRSAAIYAAVMFLPLGFATMVWPAAWKWSKRLIEFLIAIIVAKVLIVAIMSLAASGMANSGWGDGFEGVLAGSAMLLLAAASPAALLKLIPIAEAGLSSASDHRQALRRATYAGSVLTGSQVVSGMIQSRFRSNTALPTAAAAGAGGAAGAAAGALASQARALPSAARNRVDTALDSAPVPATTPPAPPPARTPSPGGSTSPGSARPADSGDAPFTNRPDS